MRRRCCCPRRPAAPPAGESSTAAPSGDGSSTAESSQGGASAGGDTVTVCYHGDTYVKDADGNDVMKDIFQDFTDETGINVELTYIANSDWADYTTKVQTLFASGTAPDVIYVAVENQEAFIQNDMLATLGSLSGRASGDSRRL